MTTGQGTDEHRPPDPVQTLFSQSAADYGTAYHADLLEQYKIYVGTHEHISERREGANRFFLALNTLIVGAMGLRASTSPSDELIAVACVAAMGVCVYWRRLVVAYDQLNTGKFRILHAVERQLPLSLYAAEWDALGRGREPKLYRPLTHVERGVPLVFAALYMAILAITVLNLRK